MVDVTMPVVVATMDLFRGNLDTVRLKKNASTAVQPLLPRCKLMGKKSIFEPLRITRRCNYTVWPQIVFKAWRSSGVLEVATGNRLTAGGRTHEGHTSIKKKNLFDNKNK